MSRKSCFLEIEQPLQEIEKIPLSAPVIKIIKESLCDRAKLELSSHKYYDHYSDEPRYEHHEHTNE